MERDFLGLCSKNVSMTVKQETTDDCKDSAPAMQWSFTNKVSAIPQLLSFKAGQEDGIRKTGYDSLSGLMTISSAEPFDSSHKPYSNGLLQKNASFDKKVGTHHTVTTYSQQHFDANQVHRSHEVKKLPYSNQTISVTMSIPIHQSFLASVGQNVINSSPVSPQPLGVVPVISPVSVIPATGPVVGTTELRNASKTSSGPTQLTIFYGGSVCVYDDVSLEKAQAIMLLAGNGHSTTPNTTPTIPHVQPQMMPRPSGGDGFNGIQSHKTTICGGLPSPISMTSHVGPQSAAGSSCTNGKPEVKIIGAFGSPPTKPEPSKVVVTSLGSAPTTLIPSAVPQARKASLARFLEKRKERAMSASPYPKQSPDYNATGSEGRSISKSAAGSFPLPAIH